MMSRAKLTAKDLSSGTQVKQIHHVRAKKRVQNSADQGTSVSADVACVGSFQSAKRSAAAAAIGPMVLPKYIPSGGMRTCIG
jgi:hypothetical protein